MRVHTEETELFQFAELSDEARNNAIQHCREFNVNHDWFEFVYEKYVTFLKMIGADCELTPVKTWEDKTIWKPSIQFSGFGSQGDGASFECNYSFKAGAVEAIKSEFGGESGAELVEFAKRLNRIQRRVFYRAECKIRTRGDYNHSGTMQIDLMLLGEYAQETYMDCEDNLRQVFRDIADSLYRDLENAYEYLTSDESVIECIDANEYEFTASGKMF